MYKKKQIQNKETDKHYGYLLTFGIIMIQFEYAKLSKIPLKHYIVYHICHKKKMDGSSQRYIQKQMSKITCNEMTKYTKTNDEKQSA